MDASHIYWVGRSTSGFATVGRADLDGGNPDPGGSPPANSPSGELPLTGIPHLRPSPCRRGRSSSAEMRNSISGPVRRVSESTFREGSLKLETRGLSWKVFRSAVPHPAQGGTFLWYVRIRPKRGAAGRQIRSALRRRGWAPVTLHAVYEEERVYPTSADRRLVLRRDVGASPGWVKHPPSLKSTERDGSAD